MSAWKNGHIHNLPSSGHKNSIAQPKTDKCLSSTYYVPPFNCCLGVILQLDKGGYPRNSHVVFSPNKQRCSFFNLLCLDLVPIVLHNNRDPRRVPGFVSNLTSF